MCLAGSAPANAGPPTIEPSTSRDPNSGCTTITLKIDPKGNAIQDVHMHVAKTTHSPKGEKTDNGDPMNSHYTGKGKPAGWTYNGVGENPIPPAAGAPAGTQSSDWDVTWTSPAALPNAPPSTFEVDYCGDKGDVGAAKGTVVLTKNGQVNYNPGVDVVGTGNGFMPLPIAMTPLLPIKPLVEPSGGMHVPPSGSHG